MLMVEEDMIPICFVCLGNICRSPTAEGIFIHLVDEAGLQDAFFIDSAGTSGWHEGERADRRSRATAEARGVPLPSRSRRFTSDDFERFEYVIAMDDSNLAALERMAPNADAAGRVHMLRAFDPDSPTGANVPDPYYGGDSGFDDVFDICDAGCRGLLRHLREQHGL